MLLQSEGTLLDLGIITGSLSPGAGGLFESVRLPANRLAAQGARCVVYGLRDELFDDDARQAWSVSKLQAYDAVGPTRFGYTPQMRKDVLSYGHDVLHLHGIWNYQSRIMNLWRARWDRPTVVSPRGMLDPWALKRSSAIKSAVRLLYENKNLAQASVLHALNGSEAAVFKSFGIKTFIATIPNGVNLPDLRSTPLPKPDWQAGDDRKVLLFLGRINPKKGVLELVEAWKELVGKSRAIGEAWRLAIAGWDDGGCEAEVRELIVQYDLEEHVVLTGPLFGEEKLKAYQHSHGFILPSYSEGHPMSVLEAWAHGLPAFITDACNLPDGLASGAGFGITTEPLNIAATLHEVLTDDRALAAAGQAGRELCERCYSWERVVADMLQLYNWLKCGGQRPDFVEK